MDEALIKNWNEKVKPEDLVFHLGDFSFQNASKYRDRLNGSIRFIRGNHDKAAEHYYQTNKTAKVKPFLSFEDVRMVVHNDQRIWLSHYAHRVWPHSHRGCWHLYGHSHGTLPDDPNALAIDCGVDCHNYTPLSFDEVKKIMENKTFKPIDHHGRKD
jgi:calcineurin-like phosphoesterase family protein